MREPKKQLPFKFPSRFLWGAATSAHQIEGDTHNQWSVWELENAKSLAKQAEYKQTWLPRWDELKEQATDPDNYISGKSTDHYNRFEQDFDLMQQFGMNAFRFSIEWSRIEPEEGVWNIEAIEHYRKYLKELRARDIEPMVTLMHWTLPVWFAEAGGFEKRRNIHYFVRFAEKVFAELGTDMRYICTINEPEVYAFESYVNGNWPPNGSSKWRGLKVYYNLAVAHNRVAKLAHQTSRRFRVGLSKNCAHHYPGDDARLTRASSAIATWASDYLFLNRVKRNLDWLGLNYYFTNRYYGYRIHNPETPVSDLGWYMAPGDIQFVLERLYQKYGVPIIVTENGVADKDDQHRKWWILHTIVGINKALQNGVAVEGYLHWSLLDNFEWAYGKWPNFGLIHVDYKTLKRTPRKSALWFAGLIKQIRGL